MRRFVAGAAIVASLLAGTAPVAARDEPNDVPVTRVNLGETVSGVISGGSTHTTIKGQSVPAVVLQLPPHYPEETYIFVIKTTRGEIRSRLFLERTDSGKPMRLFEWVIMDSRYRAGDPPFIGATGNSYGGPIRIELRSTGTEDAAFTFAILRVPATGSSITNDQMRAMLDRPARVLDTSASRAPDTTPWSDKAPMPPVEPVAAGSVPASYAADKPEALRPFYRALYAGGEHSAVLNFERLGLAAMELGSLKEAEWAFDQALERIEAVFGNNAVAKAAKSRWTLEAIKEFKGEPYERAMAYYYRGLLYLMAGDYENARAAFRSAEYQDTVSESEQFAGDFGVMDYLAGWSARCAGQDVSAADDFKAAAAIDPSLAAPPTNRDLLLIGEVGRPPVKTKRGSGNQLLVFGRSEDQGLDEHAEVSLAAGPVQPARWKRGARPPAEPTPIALEARGDIHFQATTRGGRPIDAILGGKAATKSTLNDIGQAIFASPEFAIIGFLFTGIGDRVKADTDIRMWDTLPDRIMLGTAIGSDASKAAFRFTGNAGAVQATPIVERFAGRCGIAWSRSRSAAAAVAGVPGNDPKAVTARAKSPEALQRDKAFRDWLTAQS